MTPGLRSAAEVTAFLDQWVVDWNDGDEEAVFGVFLPDGVLVDPDGSELTGAEVGKAWAKYLPIYTMERTGDAVDNGDGTYSFKVEWTRAAGVDKRILDISIDGDRVRMIERIDPDQG